MTNTSNFLLRTRHRGLTLIELLIAITLSLAVMVGLSSVYVAAKQSFRFTETTGRLQEDAVFALDTISRGLRMAGYAGCPGINTYIDPGPPIVTTTYPTSVLSSGQGEVNFPSPVGSQQPFATGYFIRGFDTTAPSSMSPTGTAATADSLFFAGGSSDSVSLSSIMGSSSAAITIPDTFNWAGTGSGSNLGVFNFVIASCGASNIFNGTVTGNSTTASIDHSSTTTNSSAALATAYGTDAIVMPAEWNFYYVATRSGADTPSLYRAHFNGHARETDEEVVANVESMKLNYGENTNSANTIPDTWRTDAASVADWSRVVAVRIGLMMVSSQDYANPGVAQPTPTLLGDTYSVPTGASNRIRKEFSTTVVLRNRVTAR
jgi:type IV pilus assembly protein PilW